MFVESYCFYSFIEEVGVPRSAGPHEVIKKATEAAAKKLVL